MSEANPNNLAQYIEAIKKVAGENAAIVRAPSGLMNEVFLVDEKYVFRFPRKEEVYKEQQFERDVCQFLNIQLYPPVRIPRPLSMIDEPKGFVNEYIPGHTLTEDDINQLDEAHVEQFIRDALSFVNWFGRVLTIEKFDEILRSSNGEKTESWQDYIARTVAVFSNDKFPALGEVCRELMEQMAVLYPAGIAAEANRVIHDDLHMGNMLFDDNSRLQGVIDFGGIMVGDLACELRHFYRISPETARRVCDLYAQEYGEEVDITKVEWWAKMGDAAAMVSKVMTNNLDSPSYKRVLANFTEWYPEKNWSIL